MLNSFKLSLQYILPKLWLTRLAGWGASKRAGWLTKLVIDLFVKYYKVDMKDAQKPDTASYRTFNEFFVRPLRDEVRPIDTDPNVLVMPADGVISQLGKIEEDKILQAKGHNYINSRGPPRASPTATPYKAPRIRSSCFSLIFFISVPPVQAFGL